MGSTKSFTFTTLVRIFSQRESVSRSIGTAGSLGVTTHTSVVSPGVPFTSKVMPFVSEMAPMFSIMAPTSREMSSTSTFVTR